MRKMSFLGRLGALPNEAVSLGVLGHVLDRISVHRPGLAYDMGRSYGDVCLNPTARFGSPRSN